MRVPPFVRLTGLLVAFSLHVIDGTARAGTDHGPHKSIVSVGDVDGDGRDDLLVATRDMTSTDVVWIISGGNGAVLREFHQVTPGDGFGCALAAAGDVDRDGVPDALIASGGGKVVRTKSDENAMKVKDEFVRAGRAYVQVLSGKDGTLIRELELVDEPHAWIIGGDCTRVSVTGGDIDGDDVPDVLVGLGVVGRGSVRAFSGLNGKRLFELRLSQSSSVDACPSASQFGSSVALLGDLDGDRWSEFAVGHPGAMRPTGEGTSVVKDAANLHAMGEGSVTIYSGRNGRALATAWGDRPGDLFGATIVRIDDADGDGRADLVVAAVNRYALVLSSGDLHTLARVKSQGGYSVQDFFGTSLDAFGDLDGDGKPEFLVGADEEFGGFFDMGYGEIVSSKGGESLRWLCNSRQEGVDVARAGNVDGDDVPDIALALHWRIAPWVVGPGRLRFLSGKSGEVIREIDLAKLLIEPAHDASTQRK